MGIFYFLKGIVLKYQYLIIMILERYGGLMDKKEKRYTITEQANKINIVPYPGKTTLKENYIKLPMKISIYIGGFSYWCIKAYEKRTALTGHTLSVIENKDQAFICCNKKDLDNEEGYILEISCNGIQINASTERGIIWALTSLYQMTSINGMIPEAEISDAPRYRHRGLHIDCARHFFHKNEIKKILEEVSQFKMNSFHWHLSNDQGWRIEVEKYPLLYKQCGSSYYSKKDIAEIVEFAKERGIDIIPEIDMPGHTRAVLSAYPEYSCSQNKVKMAEYGGIYPVILCPGREETFSFVQNLLDEIIPMFPGNAYHIGADEAPKHEWKKCPLCQKRIRDEKLENENGLQGYFIQRVKRIAEKHGKTVYAFDDCLDVNGFADGLIIQEWMVTRQQKVAAYVKQGGSFIYSDMMDIYYDYPAAMSNMERSYTVKPELADKDFSDNPFFLGFEACVWTEHISEEKELEKKIFPRIYALAENGWTCEDGKDYKSFKERLSVLNEKKKHEETETVANGNGDPEGEERRKEAVHFIRTLNSRIPEDAAKDTVEPDVTDEEFNRVFGIKMLNAHGDAMELMELAYKNSI